MFDGGNLLGWILGGTALYISWRYAVAIAPRPVPDILNPDDPDLTGDVPELE